MTDPKISVVIPCYNGADFLAQTLESVMRQTWPPAEIIVIDDGSTDNSEAIAASLGAPIRVIRQTNQGESVARNRGINEAKGSWIAFLDADDLWHPTKLEKQRVFLQGDTLAVCTGNSVLDSETGNIGTGVRSPSYWGPPSRESLTPEWIVGVGVPCMPSSLVVRADLPIRFPTWTRFSEDAVYLLELIRMGNIQIVPEPLITYREHAKSQSMSFPDIEVKRHSSIDRWIVEYSNICDLDDKRRLRILAVSRLIRMLERAYWQRDWDRFDMLYKYIVSRDDLPGIESRHRASRYPRWCYWVKDIVDSLIGRRMLGAFPVDSSVASRPKR
jgi:glycosyltransferase involved in cell wall biosynthesis